MYKKEGPRHITLVLAVSVAGRGLSGPVGYREVVEVRAYINHNTNLIKKQVPTLFQQAVYRVVARIPRGRTMTYVQVARAIGNPKAVRAVGNALNKNPFAPAVPCHRVIRSDGTLGGFASGITKKRALLRREGAIV